MQIFLLFCVVAVLVGIAYGAFRFWMEGTQGEVGPALMATTLTMILIGFCLYFAIDALDGPNPSSGPPAARHDTE